MLPSHVCYQISAPNWTFNHPQPGTCLSPNNPTIHSLVYKSAEHPISLEQTHDDFMMIHNQPIYPISTIQYQYKSSIFSTPWPSAMDPPWIPQRRRARPPQPPQRCGSDPQPAAAAGAGGAAVSLRRERPGTRLERNLWCPGEMAKWWETN